MIPQEIRFVNRFLQLFSDFFAFGGKCAWYRQFFCDRSIVAYQNSACQGVVLLLGEMHKAAWEKMCGLTIRLDNPSVCAARRHRLRGRTLLSLRDISPHRGESPFTQGSLCERAMTEVLRLKGHPSVSLRLTPRTRPSPSVAARHLPTLWGVTPLGEPTGRRGRWPLLQWINALWLLQFLPYYNSI